MAKEVWLGSRVIGPGYPTYVIAEIGLNHNGDPEIAKSLIDVASAAGCDAVKFQKRTVSICVPPDQAGKIRQTPWGEMTYLEYRERMEFGLSEFTEIDRHCREKNIHWFASCWDRPSVDFMEKFEPPCYKIASASLTNCDLLRHVNDTGRPVILSTGMSPMGAIEQAVEILGTERLLLAHSTSSYPCAIEELNLRMVQTLEAKFPCPIGYSGHEVGLQTTFAAVTLGACFVERHVTLDRTMWGSDHAASVEPEGVVRLVRDIRIIERALGDGIKRVYDSERPLIQRLRTRT